MAFLWYLKSTLPEVETLYPYYHIKWSQNFKFVNTNPFFGHFNFFVLPWQKISPKKFFFKPPFGALSKIGDQIRKYVVKDHGFPFIKWCDT